jgi:hypothetical protein
MQRIKPWLERDFSFDMPAWMFAHVVERLRGGPARLEDTLRNVSALALTHREDNSWSMEEEAGHLVDVEPLMSERLEQLISGARVLKAWDGTNEATWKAQHVPSHWRTSCRHSVRAGNPWCAGSTHYRKRWSNGQRIILG